jgi:nitrite reductase/ring-hydroxylating ferredoxin subunit
VGEHVICRVEQLVEGRGRPARAAGMYLAVFLAKGEIAVVENTCTHVGSPLDGGAVIDQRVHCPWHGWAYDLRSGNLLTAFGERPGIRVFPHRVENGEVIVQLEDDLRN